MSEENKITLFILSEKGYTVLKSIVKTFGSEVIALVIVGFDKNVVHDYSEDILLYSKKHNIPIVDKDTQYNLSTKYAIAISWRWLIPINNNLQLITLHDSLLPKYRGFSPMVNQLICQEKYLGVSAIWSTSEYDRGDIIMQLKTPIHYPIKIQTAISKITKLYSEIVVSLIKSIVNGTSLSSVPQNEGDASYSLWKNDDDYAIDWSKSASYIKRFIDAVGTPYKGASSKIFEKKIRIYDATEEPDVNIVIRDYGKTIFMKDGNPVVVCGEGLLKIKNAVYEDTGASIFPLKKFRIRFT